MTINFLTRQVIKSSIPGKKRYSRLIKSFDYLAAEQKNQSGTNPLINRLKYQTKKP